jgi:hypothetical protein
MSIYAIMAPHVGVPSNNNPFSPILHRANPYLVYLTTLFKYITIHQWS